MTDAHIILPMIFSAPMIRALLDGRKTQTRRYAWRTVNGDDAECFPTPWQRVKLGDRLWVRETHYRFGVWRKDGKTKSGRQRWRFKPLDYNEVLFIDAPPESHRIGTTKSKGRPVGQWWKRPSIHMPRWASRLTLIVTEVRRQPLLDISEDDARAEGFKESQLNDGFGPRDIGSGYTIESPGTYASAAGMFQIAWAEQYPKWDGYSSPEVVAMTFTVHRQNIDTMERAAA